MALIRKATFNFVLEGAILLLFMSLIATGLAMHFTLPPGSGERLTQWGLSRHGWGDVHFWLAATVIGLMLLHLLLHWRWIWGMARGADPRRCVLRGSAFLLATLVLLALALLPWLIPVRPGHGGDGAGRGGGGQGRGFRGGRNLSLDFQQPGRAESRN